MTKGERQLAKLVKTILIDIAKELKQGNTDIDIVSYACKLPYTRTAEGLDRLLLDSDKAYYFDKNTRNALHKCIQKKHMDFTWQGYVAKEYKRKPVPSLEITFEEFVPPAFMSNFTCN